MVQRMLHLVAALTLVISVLCQNREGPFEETRIGGLTLEEFSDLSYEEQAKLLTRDYLENDNTKEAKTTLLNNLDRLKALQGVPGRTFTTAVNELMLLSDEELEHVFGLTPATQNRAESPKLSSFLKLNPHYPALVKKYGAEFVRKAHLIFVDFEARLLELDLTVESKNIPQVFESFVEKLYESESSDRLKDVADALLDDIFPYISVKKEQRRKPADRHRYRPVPLEPEVQQSEDEPTRPEDRPIKNFLWQEDDEEEPGALEIENVSGEETILPPLNRGSGAIDYTSDSDLGAFLAEAHYDPATVANCKYLNEQNAKIIAGTLTNASTTEFIDGMKVHATCLGNSKLANCPKEMERRCMNDDKGIPYEFNDWETLGYTKSLLNYREGSVMPASWAHAASQIMDLYQQIYSKNVTYYRSDLVNVFHLMGCVYRGNGLGRGSPQAAFQHISEKVTLPKLGGLKNCRDASTCANDDAYETSIASGLMQNEDSKKNNIFYKFYHLKKAAEAAKADCSNTANFDPTTTAIPDVQFVAGRRGYIRFSDTKTRDVWVISKLGFHRKTTVYGEDRLKPTLYLKGPVAGLMAACYEMFLVSGGIFNFNCQTSTRRYLQQWVTITSYGPDWLGVVIPQFNPPREHGVAYTKYVAVSRAHEYTFNWNSFVFPRVQPYTNTANCANSGITYQPDDQCLCTSTTWGPTCNATTTCGVTCYNGGTRSAKWCGCDCPRDRYGRECTKKCDCGLHGKCDDEGNCICQRQMSWGTKCENRCTCNNGGYCHGDGTCECMGGWAGPKCDVRCTKQCSAPRTCLHSNAGGTATTSCGCPHGFYGPECRGRVDCQRPDTGSADVCRQIAQRNRCSTDRAMELCPHSCGHCFFLNTKTDMDL